MSSFLENIPSIAEMQNLTIKGLSEARESKSWNYIQQESKKLSVYTSLKKFNRLPAWILETPLFKSREGDPDYEQKKHNFLVFNSL